jgi:hypothetical protein
LAADTSALITTTSHISSGGIAGAVIGAVAGATLIAGGAFLLRKRYKNRVLMRQTQTELDNEDFYADPFNQRGLEDWNQQNQQFNAYTDHDPMDMGSTRSTGRNSAGMGAAVGVGAAPMAPRHQTPYGNQQTMSDNYDEYGHPREQSLWSSITQRFRR